ncbi:MAG: hypothetical protein QXH78_01445, partial [Desulfurococcaceae archaeon]
MMTKLFNTLLVFAVLILLQGSISQFLINKYSQVVTNESILVELEMNIDGGAVSFIENVVKTHPGKIYILEINSYGGYLSAADKIISIIERSGSYCISWIPPGGYAVSAAALIALSCKEIYMGPGAVIGGIKPSPEDPKVIEYVKARARSLLEKQG